MFGSIFEGMSLAGMIPAGFVVGVIVGLVGVGGGSLMTPILVLVFGIAPKMAVGTDLLFASITKAVGVWVHHGKHRSVDWKIVRLLSWGSLPGCALTLVAMHFYPDMTGSLLIQKFLAIALVLGSLALWFGDYLKKRVLNETPTSVRHASAGWTIFSGFVLGVLVSLTSIGAGALGTVMLLLLYPHFRIKSIVGTDLAHAIPLTALAGLGHAKMGNVDYSLLLALLLGSVPGIYLGSRWSGKMNEKALKFILATMLFLIAWKFLSV